MISDEEIEKVIDWLRDNASKAAQARANRVYIEEFRKTLKAQIMRERATDALGAQEREAYADPRYGEHLKALEEAVRSDEYYRWMQVAAEAKLEAWRTQSANRRTNV